MRKKLLKYIVCPSCQADLGLHTEKEEDDRIISGSLVCSQCGKHFPIINSIPRLLIDLAYEETADTSDAFGWEWQEFQTLHGFEDYKNQFFDWILPIQPEFFAGKVVLDAGCGMGRFAIVSSTLGAKEVLAIDVSSSVEAAAKNARDFPNVHVIQADIYNLPLRREKYAQIDFAYSIGVLHHLPYPEEGFQAVVRTIKPGGTIFGWVYGRENNGWLVNFVNPIRKKLTSRLPRKTLYYLSLIITLALHPLLKLFYSPAASINSLSWLNRILPYSAYMGWLSQFGFRHNHHVVFDHLVAPTAFYITREEYTSWFEHMELNELHITHRNENSWRGVAEVQQKHD